MTYALGRSVEYFDMPVVRQIVRDADRNGDRFGAIVMGIVGSPEFQTQQPHSDGAKPSDQTASNGAERQPRPAT